MAIAQKSRKVNFLGETESHGEAIKKATAPGDAVLVVRGRPRSLILRCPCGCGDLLTINLDRRADKAWLLFRAKSGFTLYPSVWRDSGCESHFVIWRGQISWIGEYDLAFDDLENEDFVQHVLIEIPSDRFVDASTIAGVLGADPWDVLYVCRRLRDRGNVAEGKDKQQGFFRKIGVVRS